MNTHQFAKYVSHKKVHAGRIADGFPERLRLLVEHAGLNIVVEVSVPEEFFARGIPHAGDYYVEYEDGYQSWSPKAAFEAGYTRVAHD